MHLQGKLEHLEIQRMDVLVTQDVRCLTQPNAVDLVDDLPGCKELFCVFVEPAVNLWLDVLKIKADPFVQPLVVETRKPLELTGSNFQLLKILLLVEKFERILILLPHYLQHSCLTRQS